LQLGRDCFRSNKNGRLQNLDCVLNEGIYYDAYTFNSTAGQQNYITLNSTQFNAYLILFHPAGEVAQDDNGGGTKAGIPENSEFSFFQQPELKLS
jgi:hypothetical protein